MAELGLVASVVAVIQLTSEVISLLCKYGDEVSNARNDITRLKKQLNCLAEIAESAQRLLKEQNNEHLKTSHKLLVAFQEAHDELQKLQRELSRSGKRKAINQILIWPFRAWKIEKATRDLERCIQIISTSLQIDQTLLLLQIETNTSRLDQSYVLDRLNVAEGAAYDSYAEEHAPTCHPQTRTDLLQEISRWPEEHRSVPVFWLVGMAGTGKSTISRTVARSLAAADLLAASFFFKRGEGDRCRAVKVLTTVVAQIIESQPALARHVKYALQTDPRVTQKSIREQFQKLILDPLSKVESLDNPTTLIVVVDALDECEEEDDIKLLIQLFCSTSILRNTHLRFFVSSRHELPVRLGLNNVTGMYQKLILHEVPPHVIRNDIAKYLEHELGRIQTEFDASVPADRVLSTRWPIQADVQKLVEMAVPLFIFAATVCRFLADRKTGNPESKLNMILEYKTNSHRLKLDATYLPILQQQLAGLSASERTTAIENIRIIIGSIVLLANPLTTKALAELLNIPKVVIDDRLDLFHSVLRIPTAPSYPVRLFHLSFREFLLDPENSVHNPCWVDEQEAHGNLASHCLRLMSDRLSKDICGLGLPGTPRSEIDNQVIQECLPAEVQYACMYWTYHLQAAHQHIHDYAPAHTFLLEHFLHWVEALSIMDKISEGLGSMEILLSLLAPESSGILNHFLTDAYRFFFTYAPAINLAPLQVYFSALIFAPEKSIVKTLFSKELADGIFILPGVESDWQQYEQTLEGHNDMVTSVTFSHDSKFLLSGSWDKTIRLWSAGSCELYRIFRGHTGNIKSVAFSHNSDLIASASVDKTVRIWSAATGELERILQHSYTVLSAVFSHDSKLVASGCDDKVVRIWLTDTGQLQQEMKGHHDAVNSVAFSHDSRLTASASDDKTIRIWSTGTGMLQRVLEGHTSLVTTIVFSHDSMQIASGSYDFTVRIWSVDTGKLTSTLKGHKGAVFSIALLRDSELIASTSRDGTIRIWSTRTSELQQTLEGHIGSVTSVSFSRESNRIVSASADKTIRIWSVNMITLQHTLQGQKNRASYDTPSYKVNLLTSRSQAEPIPIGSSDTDESMWKIDIHYHYQRGPNPLTRRDLDTIARVTVLARNHCQRGQASINPFKNYQTHCVGLGVSRNKTWITWHANNLLWLPEEYRPWCSVVLGSSILIGCDSGKAYLIKFTEAVEV